MTWQALREYCLSLPGATETFPFEPAVSVFKAPNGKMFGVTTEKAAPIDISVKCEPAIGEALRAQYTSIAPGTTSTSATGSPSGSPATCPMSRCVSSSSTATSS